MNVAGTGCLFQETESAFSLCCTEMHFYQALGFSKSLDICSLEDVSVLSSLEIVTNQAARTLMFLILCEHELSFLLDEFLGVTGRVVRWLLFILAETVKLFPGVVVPLRTPTSSV